MMRGSTSSGLRRLAGALCCGLAVMAASCAPRVNPDPNAPENLFAAPAKGEQANYLAQLKDLPLRTGDANWSLNLRPGEDCLVREVHLLRDVRNPAGDLVLMVYDDLMVQAVTARDFAVKWMTPLRNRTSYAPVMTSNSVFFIDGNGSYQQFNRASGRLVKTGDFGAAMFPSGQMAANDSHIVVPTTNQNGVRAWADGTGEAEVGAPQNWSFPNRFTQLPHRFDMVQHQPIADLEAIYFVGNNNYLYGVDAQSGNYRFAKDLGRNGVVRTAPLLHRDVIYCGSDRQLYAFSRAGEELWSFTADGPIDGSLYAMDDQVFFRTLRYESSTDRSGKFGGLSSTRTTQPGGGLTVRAVPQSFGAVSVTRTIPPVLDPDADIVAGQPSPIRRDEAGNPVPDTPVVRGPRAFDWKTDNLGQEVLLRTKSAVFVMMEEWEIPYGPETIRALKNSRKVVKDSELRSVTRRVIQMLDAKTGAVMQNGGEAASYEVPGFPFVVGSRDGTDRALYIATADGYLFKAFAIN